MKKTPAKKAPVNAPVKNKPVKNTPVKNTPVPHEAVLDESTPSLLPPDQMHPIRTPADLTSTWRTLMGELRFTDRRLWLLFIEPDGRLLGPLLSLDDLPDGPYDLEVDEVVSVCRDILEGPGARGSVAMLITRPGRDRWHVGDRAWGRYLVAAAHRIGGQVWPVHRANDRELGMVPADEVGGRATARSRRRPDQAAAASSSCWQASSQARHASAHARHCS